MENLKSLGEIIRDKRLSMNLRMDDVAKKANITRATLWSIEKGNGNYSISTLLSVMNILGLSFSVEGSDASIKRDRATRINTVLAKKINRFVIMCVEQYAGFKNKDSDTTYKKMSESGVIDELTNDYEDLHGMSTMWLNDYIDKLIEAK